MNINTTEINKLKDLFIKLASIDNPSWKEEKIVEWITHELWTIWIIPQVDEFHNVFFQVEWEWTPLFLNAHLDSVNPCIWKEVGFKDDIFFSKWNTVLSADDIEGVAIIITIVKYFKENNIKHRPLDILFTSQEEIGGAWIKNFDLWLFNAKEWVVLDSASPVGKIVTKAPAKYNFTFFIQWIAGHWSQTKNTFSAITMMTDIIYNLPKWQINEFVKLNIWRIEWGKALNTVAWDAYINWGISVFSDWEIRWESVNCKEIIKKIEEVIFLSEEKYPKGKVEFKYEKVRHWYDLNKEDDFIKSVEISIKQCWLEPEKITTKWVSDSNTFHELGYKWLLLWTGATWLHTVDEKVSLTDMVKLMEITMSVCMNWK